MENEPFEDVFPIEDGNFPLPCYWRVPKTPNLRRYLDANCISLNAGTWFHPIEKDKIFNHTTYHHHPEPIRYPSFHNHGSEKKGPSNIRFLSFRVIFHFHDYGRKSKQLSYTKTPFLATIRITHLQKIGTKLTSRICLTNLWIAKIVSMQ